MTVIVECWTLGLAYPLARCTLLAITSVFCHATVRLMLQRPLS